MPVDLLWNRKRSVLFFVFAFLALFLSSGCAFHYVNQASFDVPQIKEEKIQRIAVLVFDNPPLSMQAGMHISRLFELYLLRTGVYKIAERGEVETVLRERGIMISPAGPAASLQQLGDPAPGRWDRPRLGEPVQPHGHGLLGASGVGEKRLGALVGFGNGRKHVPSREQGGRACCQFGGRGPPS